MASSKEYMKEYQKKNKEKLNKRAREYAKAHRQEKREYLKKYRKKNREKIAKKNKEYREKNKLRMIRWRIDNKEHIKNYSKKYTEKNKEKIRKRMREYVKKRKEIDPAYLIEKRVRNRVRVAINEYANTGKIKTSKKYDINYKAIIEHLKPFPENKELYHVDHIIPICSFDFNDPSQIKKAFAPENHQWLIAKENLSKGGKILNR